MTRIAAAVLLVGLVAFVGVSLASPTPRDIHGLSSTLAGRDGCPVPDVGAGIDARGERLAIWGGYPVSYDAANDTTFVLTRFCSHRLMAPGVLLQGDWTARSLDAPLLLSPGGERIAVYEATIPPNASVPAAPGASSALGPNFSVGSPWPPFAAKALLLAVIAGSAAWLTPYSRDARIAIAVVASASIGFAAMLRGGYWLIVGLLMIPLVPLALGMLAWTAVALVRRKRAPAAAVGVLLAVAAFFTTALLTLYYFPANGAGD